MTAPPVFLIKTAGRTGSRIIMDYVYQRNPQWLGLATEVVKSPRDFSQHEFAGDRISVVHDHSTWLPPAPLRARTVLIISDRRDAWAWIVSRYVARQTGLYARYSSWDPDQEFVMDWQYVVQVWQGLQRQRSQYQEGWALGWAGRAWVYHEDLPRETRPRVPELEQVSTAQPYPVQGSSDRAPWNYAVQVQDYEALRTRFYQEFPEAGITVNS